MTQTCPNNKRKCANFWAFLLLWNQSPRLGHSQLIFFYRQFSNCNQHTFIALSESRTHKYQSASIHNMSECYFGFHTCEALKLIKNSIVFLHLRLKKHTQPMPRCRDVNELMECLRCFVCAFSQKVFFLFKMKLLGRVEKKSCTILMIGPKSESDNLVNQSKSNVKWNECEQRETLAVPSHAKTRAAKHNE